MKRGSWEKKIRVKMSKITPSPKSNSVPLFDLETFRFLGRRTSDAGTLAGRYHYYVCIHFFRGIWEEYSQERLKLGAAVQV